ncbi:N-formylglutamate deformylase [Pararhizobium sp.]|uniref:N-formylglutamate deformylase n=1 Tax=Pararhizobium sp. TaxID=1977563 RepID=UPI0027237668|nr:N-formylglutamate deformylase [Pararhizobium sp.]MDO9416678.1 N-formylglutamate deformylase [Pararhizobium sp.]
MIALDIVRGERPLLVSLPHTGTQIPAEIADTLVSLPLALNDTDWWIDTLYDFALHLGATVIRTHISRTVIDVNRDPSGVSLYPGQATTELCPLTSFDGTPLYKPGMEPDAAEIARRQKHWFDPYHAAIAAELARLRENHETVVLYDCHSIRSVIPRLFDGELPVFNIGTNSGASCAPELQHIVETACEQSGFSHVTNGRFKGGWITRNNGRPESGIHAVQMEIACRGYMDEHDAYEPAAYDAKRAAPMRAVLEKLFSAILHWAEAPRS